MAKVTVEVCWKGPWTIGREELGNEPRPECLEDKAFNGRGLYAIYGTHVVFGRHALLYIGRTRNFRDRVGKHWDSWLKHAQEPTIHLGSITKPADEHDYDKLLAAVEALTIWWHSPPYNSKNIQSWLPRSQATAPPYPNLEVQNDGQIGSLNWMYSTYWANKRNSRPIDSE